MCEVIMRKNCPICDSHKVRVLYNRLFSGMHDIVPFSSYTVIKCEVCGMVYAGDIVQEMPLGEYYNRLSKYETQDFFKVSQAKAMDDNIITFLERYISVNDKILEIGCGMGNLLYQFQQHGYKNLVGIEPSLNNVEGIVQRWNIPCYQGTLGEEIPKIKKQKFRLIIMEGVLEHILPLKECIKQCMEYLDNGSYIFLKVPDITDWGDIRDLYQQFSVEHINYFSLQSLSNLLGMYGLRCVKYEVDGLGNSKSLWQYSFEKKETVFANDGDVALSRYLKQASSLVKQIRTKLELLYKDKKVYLWGAGTHTAMLYQMGLLDGLNVQAIIDSNENYHGKSIFGVKIISPNELLTMDKLPIIISSQTAQKSIKEQISELCDNEVLELY